jgi:hypothetical protein
MPYCKKCNRLYLIGFGFTHHCLNPNKFTCYICHDFFSNEYILSTHYKTCRWGLKQYIKNQNKNGVKNN